MKELTYNSVDNVVNNMFIKFCNCDFINGKVDLRDEYLFSSKLNIEEIQLVAIFLLIEEYYNIRFDEEKILNDGFATYNNIVSLIIKSL